MKRLSLTIILILMLLIGISSAQINPQEQSAESYLMSYINTLNRHDYLTAYRMIDNRSDTYADFVAGYAHTLRIAPYFGVGGGAAGSTYVTTILLGYQDDGTIQSYYGYFQLHSGMIFDPIRNNGGWVIGNARFQLLQDGDALHNDVMADLLSQEWQENPVLPTLPIGQMPTLSEMNSQAANTILNYYDLINHGDFDLAYPQWLTRSQGLSRDYRLPYSDFVAGYADTHTVTVYAGAAQGVATGYFSAYLPTVLVSEHTDGTFESYSGCYALGFLGNSHLGIINGRFSLLKEDVPNSEEIFEAIDSLNCATLGMGI